MEKRITALLLALSVATAGLAALPSPAEATGVLNGGYFTSNAEGLGDSDLDVCFDTSGVWTTALQNVVLSGFSIWQERLDMTITNHGTACFGTGTGTRNVKVVWTEWGVDCAYYGNAARTAWGPTAGDTYVEIQFNQTCPNFTWYVGNNPIVYGYMDAESIAMHELGHALGMAQNTVSPHIMNLGVDCVWSRQVQYTPGGANQMSTQDAIISANYDGNPSINIFKGGSFPSTITCIE